MISATAPKNAAIATQIAKIGFSTFLKGRELTAACLQLARRLRPALVKVAMARALALVEAETIGLGIRAPLLMLQRELCRVEGAEGRICSDALQTINIDTGNRIPRY